MHTVKLQRAFNDNNVTFGMMDIEGVSHDPIFSLENPLRETNVDSRIPKGSYLCLPFIGVKYKGVYEVCSVPGRTAILIHWGNFEEDTEGCILVGDGAGMLNRRPAVLNSRNCFKRFKELLDSRPFILDIYDQLK